MEMLGIVSMYYGITLGSVALVDVAFCYAESEQHTWNASPLAGVVKPLSLVFALTYRYAPNVPPSSPNRGRILT